MISTFSSGGKLIDVWTGKPIIMYFSASDIRLHGSQLGSNISQMTCTSCQCSMKRVAITELAVVWVFTKPFLSDKPLLD